MTDRAVLDLKTFLPAKDFEISRRFYHDLGFEEKWCNDEICEMEIGQYRFLLQNFHVPEFAQNFMMSLLVKDVDRWWSHILDLGLKEKYNLNLVRAPELQPWGLRVLYLSDPSGVLWHIAQDPAGRP